MLRLATSAIAGAVFGLGLYISGMTDTTKVQGWLDFFGAWDPTLAFVMGGAILPMIAAWQIAERRTATFVLQSPIPPKPQPVIDARLVTGSALFGAGWALAGLCPGPAMASLGFGGPEGLLFFMAMVAGMLVVPYLMQTRSFAV